MADAIIRHLLLHEPWIALRTYRNEGLVSNSASANLIYQSML